MKKIIVSLLAGLVLVTGAACDSSKPAHEYTYTDCKSRMERDFQKAMDNPDAAPQTHRPKECTGVSDAQLQKIVGEILNDALDG